MSYIEKSLGQGEQIQGLFRFHWIELARILFYYVLCTLAVLQWPVSVPFNLFPWSLLLFILPVTARLRYLMIEMGCTSRRVILKTGIIARETDEHIIEKIETIEIDESILGRLLGYGSVKITGTGVSALTFARVRDPIGVKKMIEACCHDASRS